MGWAEAAAAFACLLLAACGSGGSASPGSESLSVTISGLPAGSNANVVVVGPNNFQRTVLASATLTGLAAGSYVVSAVPVTVAPRTFTGTVTGSPVALGGGVPGAVTVAYGTTGDPLYGDQWHLRNTGQLGGTAGEDVNVEPVWMAGIKGNGVRIAVVDDGLEIAHEDLTANIATGQSYNYLNAGTDPTGGAHGTSVAGVAAARDDNGYGVRGAASRANLVGYNLLMSVTTVNEADAMTRNAAAVFVSNNSWGPNDGTGLLDAAPSTWKSAIDTGLASGRSGRGTIYMWAAGNGGSASTRDNSNYDGYASYRGVIAVAALGNTGVASSYSEPGANIWVSAYGGEFCTTAAITTTDRTGNLGENTNGVNYTGAADYADLNYTRCFNGTSSATPLAAGVVALMLEANPNLGWRDVRAILAATARQNHAAHSDWALNGAGLPVNHQYGFGVVNAQAAVTAAQSWTNLPPLVTSAAFTASPAAAIPDNNTTGVSSTINVAGSGIASLEWVEVTFSATHTYSGDLEVTLTAPSGTVSRLSETHLCAGACSAYSGWVFGSARHLGEAANGNWTLTVKDRSANDTGTFSSWALRFYGH